MFIKKLSKRERYAALAAFLFVFTVIVYNFAVDPIARQWQALNNEIMAKTAMLKKDLGVLASRKALEAEYVRFSKYLKQENNEEETIAEVLACVEKISRENSCQVINVKPMGTRDFGAYKEIMIDVNAEADARQFSKFFYDIENADSMILKVRRFTLTSKAGQPGILKGTFLISKVVVE